MRKNTKQVDELFKIALQHFPDLKYPFFWVGYKPKSGDFAQWEFDHIEGFGNVHKISINFSKHTGKRDLLETICHELIHAQQQEERRKIGHGKFFLTRSVYFYKMGLNTLSGECDAKQWEKVLTKCLN